MVTASVNTSPLDWRLAAVVVPLCCVFRFPFLFIPNDLPDYHPLYPIGLAFFLDLDPFLRRTVVGFRLCERIFIHIIKTIILVFCVCQPRRKRANRGRNDRTEGTSSQNNKKQNRSLRRKLHKSQKGELFSTMRHGKKENGMMIIPSGQQGMSTSTSWENSSQPARDRSKLCSFQARSRKTQNKKKKRKSSGKSRNTPAELA